MQGLIRILLMLVCAPQDYMHAVTNWTNDRRTYVKSIPCYRSQLELNVFPLRKEGSVDTQKAHCRLTWHPSVITTEECSIVRKYIVVVDKGREQSIGSTNNWLQWHCGIGKRRVTASFNENQTSIRIPYHCPVTFSLYAVLSDASQVLAADVLHIKQVAIDYDDSPMRLIWNVGSVIVNHQLGCYNVSSQLLPVNLSPPLVVGFRVGYYVRAVHVRYFNKDILKRSQRTGQYKDFLLSEFPNGTFYSVCLEGFDSDILRYSFWADPIVLKANMYIYKIPLLQQRAAYYATRIPNNVEGLKVENSQFSDRQSFLYISWRPPTEPYGPLTNYIIYLDSAVYKREVKMEPTRTNITLKMIKLSYPVNITVFVTAFNIYGGRTTKTSASVFHYYPGYRTKPPLIRKLPNPIQENWIGRIIGLAGTAIIIPTALVSILIYICKKRRDKGSEMHISLKPQTQSGLKFVPSESLTVGSRMLGYGVNGIVHEGYFNKMKVAVKTMKECKCCCRILHVLGRIGQERHANIIAILGYTVNEVTSLILFVHELSPFGNLLQWMHQIKLTQEKVENMALRQSFVRSFSYQLSFGMEHLSYLGIVHRDLAARNILLFPNSVVKICDFDLAVDMNINVQEQRDFCISHVNEICFRWAAPEVVEENRFSTKSDVWSFGVLVWEILTLGEKPYKEWIMLKHSFLEYQMTNHLKIPEYCDDFLKDLLLSCWVIDFTERPTFSQLHQWLQPYSLSVEQFDLELSN